MKKMATDTKKELENKPVDSKNDKQKLVVNKDKEIKESKSSDSLLPTVVISAAVLAVAGSFYWSYSKIQKIEDLLLSRPPLAIIDTAALAGQIKIGQEKAAIDSIDRQANALANAGYIVLRENAILTAPTDYAVPTEVFLDDIERSSPLNTLTPSNQSSPIQAPQPSPQSNNNVAPNTEPDPYASIVPTDGRTVEEQIAYQRELERQVQEALELGRQIEALNSQSGF